MILAISTTSSSLRLPLCSTFFTFFLSGWLLEGLEDECGGGWHDSDSGLLGLDADLDVNLDALPFLGSLLDIFTDLLGRHTEWRALGGKSGLSSGFSTDDFHPM